MVKLIVHIHLNMVIKITYSKDNEYYIVSTKKDIITSVYATGKDVKVDPLTIGVPHIYLKNTSINPEPTIQSNGKTYRFEMSDEDMKTQALIKYGNVYAQVYSDQESNKNLSSSILRFDTLAALQP